LRKEGNNKMEKFGLLGEKLGHSYSKEIHEIFFKVLKIKCVLMEVVGAVGAVGTMGGVETMGGVGVLGVFGVL